jgi:hypothetical protein
MKDSATRRLETFIRVRRFGASHSSAFPAGSRGAEVLAEVDAVIAEMEADASAQHTGRHAAMAGTALIAAARAELREDLEAIRRTARVMALNSPGLEDKFRLPRKARDQELLAAARSFAQEALPLRQEFTRRGLPADFIEDLNADVEAFGRAIDGKAQQAGARVAATASIDAAIERGTNAVRELDAVVRNVFRADPAALAEWTSASHTERAPRSVAGRTATTPAQPPPPAHA